MLINYMALLIIVLELLHSFKEIKMSSHLFNMDFMPLLV